MKTSALLLAAFSALFFVVSTGTINAHCEVPCGIYADQRRFEAMLEDQSTVDKAIAQINELASKDDALSKNQLARWVATKESHATTIQNTIAQYFMTQRLKADGENYEAKLKAAHAVMVAAMKTKQGVDPASSAALKDAIMAFHKLYEGK